MDEKTGSENGKDLKIDINVPASWIRRFAREIIFLLSLFGWGTYNQYTMGTHAHNTKQQFDNNKSQLDEIEQQLEKCRRDNEELKRDLKGIKRELGLQ